MTKLSKVAGLDISKDYFDVCTMEQQQQPCCTRRFLNTEQGHNERVQWLGTVPVHCTMEVTGPYYLCVAQALHSAGHRVSVVNPLVIRRYAQMLLQRAKTDRCDSALIARYTLQQDPAPWTPPTQCLITLQ